MPLITTEKLKQHLGIDHDNDDYLIETFRGWSEYELQQLTSLTVVTTVADSSTETALTAFHERFIVMSVSLYYSQRLPVTDKPISDVPGLALTQMAMMARDE